MYSSVYMDSSKKHSLQLTQPLQQNQALDALLRQKAQFYFFKMANRQITEEEMKIQFSKDILTSLLASTAPNVISQASIKEMEEHIQQNMTFLKTLYPEPKKSIINRQIFEGMKDFDFTDRVEFDLLANLGFSYEIQNKNTPRTEILNQTENLFNSLIKSSTKTLNDFTNVLMNLIPQKLSSSSKLGYETLMKQPWKFDLESDITKTYTYDKDLAGEKLFFPSIQLFRVINQWTSSLQDILKNPEKFIQQTEHIKIHNGRVGNLILRNQKKNAKIFNKFPSYEQNKRSTVDSQGQPSQHGTVIPTFEQPNFFEQIMNKIKGLCNGGASEGFSFKNVDESYQYESFSQSTVINTYLEPNIENTQKYGNYKFKEGGYLVSHFSQALQELGEEVGFKKFCEEQMQFLRKGYIQTLKVVDKNKLNQKYTMEEKKVYSFCQNCYFFMQEIVLERLVKVIQTFIRLKQKSSNEYQKCMVFQDVDLVRFNQQNAISSFIIGDEKLLIDVYKALIELAELRQVKFAKVENRFGTFSNDALIVLKIKNNPILCQLRLILEPQNSGPEQKQKSLGQMNKFLSEIESSPYGPISHMALILATKDNRVSYLQSIRKQPLDHNIKLSQVCHCGKGSISQKSSINTFEKQIKNLISVDGRINLDSYRNLIPTSFVCGVCQKVIKKGECVIPVPSCFECNFHICIDCSFASNSQVQKQIYGMLINSTAKIVDPCYFSQLELSDMNKMNYNHSYNKDVQVLSNGKTEIKKQVHYHIVMEGKNFVRFGKMGTSQQFWEEVSQKIDLRNIPQYRNAIKQDKFAGILFRPRQLLSQKGAPFIFMTYNTQLKKFSKLVYKGGQESSTEVEVNVSQISVNENDVFVPILWIFGETLVGEYITKVLQTNPFCVKKISNNMKDSSISQIRLSRSRIRSHHIM